MNFKYILGVVLSTVLLAPVFAQSDFPTAIKNCEKFSLDGGVSYKNQYFNIAISVDKDKQQCIYKEKIYQGANYELMTCRFEKGQLPFIADSMTRFNQYYKKEIAKNPIMSAKMTSNGEVFNKFLADPAICKITYSKVKPTI